MQTSAKSIPFIAYEKWPEIYRFEYRLKERLFVILVSPNACFDTATVIRLAQSYPEDIFDVDRFSNGSTSLMWGHGESFSARMLENGWMEWSFSTSQIKSEKQLMNALYTLRCVLDFLKMYTVPKKETDVADQDAFLETCICGGVLCGFSLEAELSQTMITRLEHILNDKTARKKMLTGVYMAMNCTYRDIRKPPTEESEGVYEDSMTVSDEFVAITVTSLPPNPRIRLEIGGASLYSRPDDDAYGMHFDPHNTDGPLQQIVLAVGFAALCQELHAFSEETEEKEAS